MSNIIVRSISGGILVAAIILACIFNYASWLFLLFVILAVNEWVNITMGKKEIVSKILLVSCSILFYLGFVFQNNLVFPIIGFITVLLGSWLIQMFSKNGSLKNLMSLITGFFYINIPFACVPFLQENEWVNGISYLLFIFIFLWTNDTFAYLSGKYLGRTKIVPGISPNKTLEGYIGGIVFCFLAVYILSFFKEIPSISVSLILVGIVSVFGNLGDLAESFLKRQLNIKDSGNIMPGHGGILDRFDSFIFASVAITSFLILHSYFNF